MKIIKASRELDAKSIYFLTMSPKIQRMRDAISQRIEVSSWCIYEDENSKGEAQRILSIATPENEVFATNSATFIADFLKMQDMFADCGETVNAVEVVSGQSKNGREFITCVYAG